MSKETRLNRPNSKRSPITMTNLCGALKTGQRVEDSYGRVYEMGHRGNLVRVGVAKKR